MAPRYFYKSVHVDGVANEETVETIITSTVEEPVTIDGIAFTEDTAVENHDAVLAMYIEREKIVDAPICQNLLSFDSDARICTDPFYPLGHVLPAGQDFKVGHVSGAVASDVFYTVRYLIEE